MAGCAGTIDANVAERYLALRKIMRIYPPRAKVVGSAAAEAESWEELDQAP